MRHRYVARRLVARVLTVVMAASLALQGTPAFAAEDTDPQSQGGGGN